MMITTPILLAKEVDRTIRKVVRDQKIRLGVISIPNLTCSIIR